MRKLTTKIFIMVLPFILAILVSAYSDVHKKHVLYISSYSPSFPTFMQQVEGIKSVLTANVVLDIEFMDTKRIPERDAARLFHRVLSFKLKKLPVYDAIIVADDAAFSFAASQLDKLFRGIPVFFCGVNNIPLAFSAESGDRMRGTIEAVSMRETLVLIQKLFPGRKRLAVITDGSITGQSDLVTFRHESQGLRFDIEVLSLAGLSFAELHAALEKQDDSWAILLLSAYIDRAGITRIFDEEFEEIMSHTRAPLFHLWEHGLGNGVFGGRIISHYEQGRSAAIMVSDYFNGTAMSDIRVLRESPNK